jgi:hypothetical protein
MGGENFDMFHCCSGVNGMGKEYGRGGKKINVRKG